MSYRVKAACVLAKDPEGRIHYHYQHSTIGWLSDEQAKHFVNEGLVEHVDDSDDADVDDVDDVDEEAPNKTWTRPEIDDWAKANLNLDTSGATNKDEALALIDDKLQEE
jgi:hypothetical protein